jgi:hypothetical protein
MKHFACPSFWLYYEKLPHQIKELADKNFTLLKNDPKHPSLHTKKMGLNYIKERIFIFFFIRLFSCNPTIYRLSTKL